MKKINCLKARLVAISILIAMQLGISSNGLLQASVSVSVSSLSGFTYIAASGPSDTQSFTISGSELTSDITITAPANYEISTSTNGTFVATNPIILAQTLGVVDLQTVTVRLKAGLGVLNYDNEAITIVSELNSNPVSCSGFVTCANSLLTFGGNTIDKILGEDDYIKAVTTKNLFTPVLYSSQNNDVATVESLTGLVKIKALGSTVITASQALDGGFCSNTASYTLNVVSGPVIKVLPVALINFNYNAPNGGSVAQTIILNGTLLTEPITISSPQHYEISADSSPVFGSSISLVPTAGAVTNSSVYVRLKGGLNVGTYNEDITISSPGATPKKVACSGNVACGSANLTFGENVITKILGETVFQKVATTSNLFTPIIYSNQNNDVASIDASTGLLTFKTVGSTVVTAIQASSGGYCEGTATYTLNVVLGPVITATPDALSGLTYAAASNVSPTQTFTVNGTLLTGSITLTPPSDYEISASANTGFGSSVVLEPLNGTVLDKLIYLRLKVGLIIANYNNEDILLTSPGATSKKVSCNGSVTCANPNLNFGVSVITKILGEDDYIGVVTSGNLFTPVSYISSNSNVASVNPTTGLITLKAIGTTEITATQVHQGGFCDGAAAYTLNVVSGPYITVSPATLNGFNYIAGSAVSETKTFTVSGKLLTNPIILTPPANYEISTISNADFGIPISLVPSGGTVSNVLIYVRLKNQLGVLNYNNEEVLVLSTGATTKNVICNGSVSCAPSVTSFGVSEVTKMHSDPNFTIPAILSYGTTAVYSSSNANVATVNGITGEVTLVGGGTATISAIQSARGGYCATTATYILNVIAPTISVREDPIPNMTAIVNASDVKYINVNGTNLTGNISLLISGADVSSFNLSDYSISQDGGSILSSLTKKKSAQSTNSFKTVSLP